MGTHHGGNDGNMPSDGDRPDLPELPELPPEWGEVAIPDDPSELAREAEQIREELAREQQQAVAPARSGAPAARGTEPSIGVPLLIMSVAVLITLVSLFAMAWSGTGSIAPDDPGSGTTAGDGPDQLPPVTLIDASGRPVNLAAQTPIAILLVEECECTGLVSAILSAAPPGVAVATVGHTPPEAPAGQAPSDPVPLRLGDPGGLLRAELGLPPPADTAAVVLVNQDGRITHTQPAANSVAQFQGHLTDLAIG